MPSASSHYHQLQPEDRVTIANLRQQNHSVRAIARQLHRSPATISRELQRNARSCGYGSAHAQYLSLQRRRCGRPAIKLHSASILLVKLPLEMGVLSFVQNVDKELRNGGKASTCGIHAGI